VNESREMRCPYRNTIRAPGSNPLPLWSQVKQKPNLSNRLKTVSSDVQQFPFWLLA